MAEIVLEYPNGRTFAVAVDWRVEPGMEFELYGRRWQALGPLRDFQARNSPSREPKPMLCTSLGKVA
jgi:hypothetical protein